MQYVKLKEALKEFTVFSLRDIRALDVGFHRRRLNEWQDKGYIRKVIRGYYIFSDIQLSENVLFEIANRIYSPSYVSLEMALSYYHLIPESVYCITSTSTRKTHKFQTSTGHFSYRAVKPELFFGYNLVSYSRGCFKVASIEKAILDYFYLNPNIRNESDLISLRINKDIFLEQIDEDRLDEFLDRFAKKALTERIDSFLKFIKNA